MHNCKRLKCGCNRDYKFTNYTIKSINSLLKTLNLKRSLLSNSPTIHQRNWWIQNCWILIDTIKLIQVKNIKTMYIENINIIEIYKLEERDERYIFANSIHSYSESPFLHFPTIISNLCYYMRIRSLKSYKVATRRNSQNL